MRAPMRLLALLTLSLAATAFAQEDAGVLDAGVPSEASTIFVMALESNPAAAEYAPTTMQTLAYRLALIYRF
jgi:hypothetical protein